LAEVIHEYANYGKTTEAIELAHPVPVLFPGCGTIAHKRIRFWIVWRRNIWIVAMESEAAGHYQADERESSPRLK
jgi:hypothetical protein